jgi:hypothetical protein
MTTDETVNVAWDASPDDRVTFYDWNIYSVERKTIALSGETEQTQVSFKIPKTGHYIFNVRSGAVLYGQKKYSEFIDSTQSENVNENVPFWIYGYVAPPSNVVIETMKIEAPF